MYHRVDSHRYIEIKAGHAVCRFARVHDTGLFVMDRGIVLTRLSFGLLVELALGMVPEQTWVYDDPLATVYLIDDS